MIFLLFEILNNWSKLIQQKSTCIVDLQQSDETFSSFLNTLYFKFLSDKSTSDIKMFYNFSKAEKNASVEDFPTTHFTLYSHLKSVD